MQLSIVTLGHVHAEDLTALTPYFTKLEQLVLDIAPRDELVKHRPELNRAVDAATDDWILIVREREIVGDALAKEMAEAMTGAKAWGFRVRSMRIRCATCGSRRPSTADARRCGDRCPQRSRCRYRAAAPTQIRKLRELRNRYVRCEYAALLVDRGGLRQRTLNVVATAALSGRGAAEGSGTHTNS